MKLKSNKTSKL